MTHSSRPDRAVTALVHVCRCVDGIVFEQDPIYAYPAQVDPIYSAERTRPGELVSFSVQWFDDDDREIFTGAPEYLEVS